MKLALWQKGNLRSHFLLRWRKVREEINSTIDDIEEEEGRDYLTKGEVLKRIQEGLLEDKNLPDYMREFLGNASLPEVEEVVGDCFKERYGRIDQ